MTPDEAERDRQVIHAALRVMAVEEVLLRCFANGVQPGEIATELQLSPPAVTRALRTLVRAGRAEQLPANGRWRASHRLGRLAIQAVHSLDRVVDEATESRRRLDPEGQVETETY